MQDDTNAHNYAMLRKKKTDEDRSPLAGKTEFSRDLQKVCRGVMCNRRRRRRGRKIAFGWMLAPEWEADILLSCHVVRFFPSQTSTTVSK